MPPAISIKCLNDTAAPLFRLWDEASRFETAPSMRELIYPPHITLAVFPDGSGSLATLLDDVFSSQSRLSLTFDSIAYFENDLVVLWAKPRRSDALLGLHERLHRHIDPAICHEHYRRGQWVPHCSLATNVPNVHATAAIQWAESRKEEFSVDFDAADLVCFPPVMVMKKYKLV